MGGSKGDLSRHGSIEFDLILVSNGFLLLLVRPLLLVAMHLFLVRFFAWAGTSNMLAGHLISGHWALHRRCAVLKRSTLVKSKWRWSKITSPNQAHPAEQGHLLQSIFSRRIMFQETSLDRITATPCKSAVF